MWVIYLPTCTTLEILIPFKVTKPNPFYVNTNNIFMKNNCIFENTKIGRVALFYVFTNLSDVWFKKRRDS